MGDGGEVEEEIHKEPTGCMSCSYVTLLKSGSSPLYGYPAADKDTSNFSVQQ